MKAVCAWCSVVIANPLDAGPVTHGICGACSVEQLAQLDALDAQHFRGVPSRSLGRVARALCPPQSPSPAVSPIREPAASPALRSAAGASLFVR